jgi:hypothetical protein
MQLARRAREVQVARDRVKHLELTQGEMHREPFLIIRKT